MKTTARLPSAQSLAHFLQARFPLPVSEPADVPTLWRTPPAFSPDAPISHLTLALDARALGTTAESEPESAAVFLHRPFDLPAGVWANAPVFASHRGLDAHLSVGWNPALQKNLSLKDVVLLWRDGDQNTAHPIGIVGDLKQAASFHQLLNGLSLVFGGMEAALINGQNRISRLAVVGAMTPDLIRQASASGAQGYLTGQVRDVARSEAERLGVAVYATGHKRAEIWGLKQLARELKESFPDLQTVVVE